MTRAQHSVTCRAVPGGLGRWVCVYGILAMSPLFFFAVPAQSQQQFDYYAVLSGQARVIGPVDAAGVRWQCSAKTCTTRGPWPVPGVKACNALAARVGPLAAYGYKGRILAANELRACNSGQTSTATAQPPANSALPAGQKPQPPSQTATINPLGSLFQNLANANNSNGGGSSSSVQPPANQTPSSGQQSGAGAAVATTGPVSIRSITLTLTGTGVLAGPSFSPLTIHARALQVTGTGTLSSGVPFSPLAIRTKPLTVTGTGSL